MLREGLRRLDMFMIIECRYAFGTRTFDVVHTRQFATSETASHLLSTRFASHLSSMPIFHAYLFLTRRTENRWGRVIAGVIINKANGDTR
jgi:hypothetical protein